MPEPDPPLVGSAPGRGRAEPAPPAAGSAGDPQRILVVKLADLGDLLTATPALRALRGRFPTAHITALVTPHAAPLLLGNDAVDHVLTFPKALYDRGRALLVPRPATVAAWAWALALGLRLRRQRFDVVVLLHHLTTAWGRRKYRALLGAAGAPVRVGLAAGPEPLFSLAAQDRGFGARHEVEYWLDVVGQLGAVHPAPALELHLTAAEQAAAAAHWDQLGLDPAQTVVVHPGSGTFSLARRWPVERFAAVARALRGEGVPVAAVAGPGEEALAAQLDAAVGARLPRVVAADPRALAARLRGCRLFIGNDSGVMHLAATGGVPVVAVFGLSNHRAWGPFPPARHRVVRLDLPCSPCLYRGHELGAPQGCPPRTCLTELGPDPVLAAARELLAGPPSRPARGQTAPQPGRATPARTDRGGP